MRKLPLLLTMLIIMSILVIPVNAQRGGVVGVTLVPAPVGYIYVLDHPIGDVVGVYKGRNYEMYYARTSATSKFFYITEVDTVLTKGGKYQFQITRLKEGYKVIGLDLPGKNDLVLLSEDGYVYTSSHRILFGYYSQIGEKPKDGDIVVTTKIDLRIKEKVSYLIPVTEPNTKVTIITDKYTKTVNIADLVGVQDTCIAFISRPPSTFQWYGGLIPTPLCTKDVRGVIRDTYNGQPLYTVFAKNIEGHLVYVAFSRITPNLLVKMGFLVPVQTNPSVHIVKTTLDNMYLYFSKSKFIQPTRVDILNTIDSTVDLKTGRVCVLPVKSEIVFYLGWDLPPNNTSQISLKPGEVILYRTKSSNTTYLCTGDLSFLDVYRPSIIYPKIKQFHEPIGVQSGITTVIMLGNGKYYYGTKIKIPFEEYDGNTVWILSKYPRTLKLMPQALWATPFFWLSVLLGILFTALILQKPRTHPRKIQIVWDIATPPPLEFPDKATIMKRVSQYIDIFGVCPNDVELAERGVLLPAKDEKPTDEIIVCNFKTNIETEKILREVVKVANGGFWAFKRRGKNYGFLYTLIGDTLIVFYLYKQENEKSPSDLLINAIKSAIRTYIGIPLHTKYHGLVIVATPDMARKLREELVRAGVIDEAGRVGDIGGYLSIKYPDIDEKFRNRIIEFVKERIPLILIVSDDMTPLITVLGEIASQYYEAYLKRRGIKDEEEE